MDLEKILILKEIEKYKIKLTQFVYPYISNVNEIKDFLINHNDLYQRAVNYCIAEFDDGTGMLHPLTYADLSGRYEKEVAFIDKYKYMMEIIDLNKFESIFIEELEEYNNISNSIKDVQKWLDKVEIYFELDNLLQIEHHTKSKIDFPSDHIIVYFWDNTFIFLNRRDFIGAIILSSLFTDLLWEQEIHPENRFYIEFNK
jgi:hypothetical protein